MTTTERSGAGLGPSIALSIGLHAAALAALILSRPAPSVPTAPIYRVELIAAPAGPRSEGIVRPSPTPPPPTPPRPTPARPETQPREMPAPTKAPERWRPRPMSATPTVPRPAAKAPDESAAVAGGGPAGGTGADVASVRTEGIEFPFPGYLNNIVRQIALRFNPEDGAGQSAEVSFLLHRDGRVSSLRFTRPSRSYAFNLEAQGAIEQAARAGAFGPLPSGFPDDVLPVIFSFDPRLLR